MNDSREKPRERNYDGLISAAGAFGKYQWWYFTVIALVGITGSMTFLCNTMLSDGQPEYTCVVPDDVKHNISEACNATWTAYQDNHMVPWSNKTKKYDHCYRLIIDTGEPVDCSYWFPANTSSPYSRQQELNTTKCSRWSYKSQNFRSTVAMEFDLVCDDIWKDRFSSLCLMFGILFGAFIFGSCSDRFGRKPTLAAAFFTLCFCEFTCTFVRNYAVYCVLLFCVGAGFIGATMVGFIGTMEILTGRHRIPVTIFLSCTFSVGLMLIALVGYLVSDWRIVGRVTSATAFVLLGIYLRIGFESPRWLSANNRHRAADEVIRKIAKINSREHKLILYRESSPGDHNGDIEMMVEKKEKEEYEAKQAKHSTLELFTNSTLRRITFVMAYNWFAASTVYYGLSLSATLLGENLFLNVFFTGLVEIPANVAIGYLMKSWGRRPSIMLFHTISGMGLLCMMLSPGIYWLTLVFFLAGKFGVAGAFNGIYLYTTELYPTPNRGNGLGLCSGSARFGGLFAVGILFLGTFSKTLPFIIFGILGLLAGILVGILPETKLIGFPETITECESMEENRTTSLKSQCLPCLFAN